MRLFDLALACTVLSWLTGGVFAQGNSSMPAYAPSTRQVPYATGGGFGTAVTSPGRMEQDSPLSFGVVPVSWLDVQGEAANGGSRTSAPVAPCPEALSSPEPVPAASTREGTTYATDGTIDSRGATRQTEVSSTSYQVPGALPPGTLPADALPPSAPPPSAPPPVVPRNQTTIDWNCAACQGPRYDFSLDAILWRMEHTRGQAVVENPLRGEVFNTDDLDLGTSVGPRISMRCLSEESEVLSGFEVTYFGVYDWGDSTTLAASAGSYLRLPDTLGDVGQTDDFSQADSMWLYSDSELNSVEANLRFGDPAAEFHLLFGPRYIRLDEQFTIDSYTGTRMSFYDVSTRNSLWGIQVGADWRRKRGCWEFDAFAKAGIYDNKAKQWTLLTDNDRTEVLRDFAAKVTTDPFVFDGGINLARRLNEVWLIRCGYSVFWMNDVARAADQLDFSDNSVSGSRVLLRQDALAHGFNIGLEATW